MEANALLVGIMQARDSKYRVLEVQELVAHAFLDEDAAGVLVDNGLFVLRIGQYRLRGNIT